jgi:hypothetical protein
MPCDFDGVNARAHCSTSLKIVELKLDGYLKTRIDKRHSGVFDSDISLSID